MISGRVVRQTVRSIRRVHGAWEINTASARDCAFSKVMLYTVIPSHGNALFVSCAVGNLETRDPIAQGQHVIICAPNTAECCFGDRRQADTAATLAVRGFRYLAYCTSALFVAEGRGFCGDKKQNANYM